MTITRREFIGTVVSTPALGKILNRNMTAEQDDPLGARKDFPILKEITSLNSAYISPCPSSVVEAGCSFLKAKAINPLRLSEMVEKSEMIRNQFARMVGASPAEIGFISSTSEGENIIVNALDFQSGDNVVVDDLHYSTSFVIYKHLEETKGVELRIVQNREGRVTPEDFTTHVNRRTRLISVAWVSHQNGFRHDMKALSELAHAHDAYLYTDAVQAIGMFPMNLRKTGIDFLASGTYKWLFAGFGVAPFYVRKELLERIPPDRRGHYHIAKVLGDYRYEIHKTAKKFEYATLSFVSIYQLGAALSYLDHIGLHRIEKHTVRLAAELRQGLADLGFRLFTPEGNASSIVAFFHSKPYKEASEILKAARIQVSIRGENRSQIRVAPALFNNSSDIHHFLDAAKKLKTA